MAYLTDSVGVAQWKNMEPLDCSLGEGNNAPSLESFTPVTNMKLWGFKDTNTICELFCIFEIPHDYKPGTDLRPHIHWTPHDDAVGYVKWQMSFSCGDNGLPFTTMQTLSAVDFANGANLYHSKEFSPVINGANLTGGALIVCRLFRDPQDEEDTYIGIAKLFSFGIHYQSAMLGSQTVFVNE